MSEKILHSLFFSIIAFFAVSLAVIEEETFYQNIPRESFDSAGLSEEEVEKEIFDSLIEELQQEEMEEPVFLANLVWSPEYESASLNPFLSKSALSI